MTQSIYKSLIENNGYSYYMTSKTFYKKTPEPLQNEYFWIVTSEESFYLLLDKDPKTFYYRVFLDPKDEEIHTDSSGKVYAESIFIEDGPFLISEHQGWYSATFCREALDRSAFYARYIHSKDHILYTYMRNSNPGWILEILDNSKCHTKWKIDIVLENPYLLELPAAYQVIGTAELNTALFPNQNLWEFIKHPERKLLKKMMDTNPIQTLKTQKITNTEFMIPYLKKKPEYISLIKDPTFTMYSVAATADSTLLLNFPPAVTFRILFGCCFS